MSEDDAVRANYLEELKESYRDKISPEILDSITRIAQERGLSDEQIEQLFSVTYQDCIKHTQLYEEPLTKPQDLTQTIEEVVQTVFNSQKQKIIDEAKKGKIGEIAESLAQKMLDPKQPYLAELTKALVPSIKGEQSDELEEQVKEYVEGVLSNANVKTNLGTMERLFKAIEENLGKYKKARDGLEQKLKLSAELEGRINAQTEETAKKAGEVEQNLTYLNQQRQALESALDQAKTEIENASDKYKKAVENKIKKAKKEVGVLARLGYKGMAVLMAAAAAFGAAGRCGTSYLSSEKGKIRQLEASLRERVDPSETILIKLDENEWPEKVERDKNEYPLIVTRDFTHPFKEKKVEYLHDRTTAERIKNLIFENEPYKFK